MEQEILSYEQTNRALKRKRIKTKAGKIAAMAFVYLILILMYAPLMYVTVFSFSDAQATGVWSGPSIKTYETLFNYAGNAKSQAIWNAAGNTLLIAVISGLVSVILGTLGAIGIFYTRKKGWKNTLEFANQIPIVNAEIVTAISLCILFVTVSNFLAKVFGIQMEMNFFTLTVGHVVLSLPYVILSVLPKLEQMDPSIYEAAMDLGATQTRALFKVVIPDIMPGILSGFMLSVTLSLDDYVITTFTKPGEFETISTYVDSAMRKGGLPIQLRSFTAILFGVIFLVMIGMNVKNALDVRKQNRKLQGVD